MKSILLSAVSGFALLSVMMVSSCKEDKCKAVVCAYEGVCQDDGSCVCQVGYEGERCETISRDKFKGTWTVTEDGTASNPAMYAVSVENGNNVDDVKIRNFNNMDNAEIMAKVKGDTIYIPSQPMQVGEEVKMVEGKGYAVPEAFYGLHGKLIISYNVINEDASVNQYGTGGAENPSIWTK